MLFRLVVIVSLFVFPAFGQTTDALVGTPASPSTQTVEAFASLPFVERAELSPDGTHIAGIFGVSGEQRIAIVPLVSGTSKAIISSLPEGTQPVHLRWVNNDNIIITLTSLMPVETSRWYVSRLVGLNRSTGKVTTLLWDLRGQNTADVLWVAKDGSKEILVAAQGSIYSS